MESARRDEVIATTGPLTAIDIHRKHIRSETRDQLSSVSFIHCKMAPERVPNQNSQICTDCLAIPFHLTDTGQLRDHRLVLSVRVTPLRYTSPHHLYQCPRFKNSNLQAHNAGLDVIVSPFPFRATTATTGPITTGFCEQISDNSYHNLHPHTFQAIRGMMWTATAKDISTYMRPALFPSSSPFDSSASFFLSIL